MQQFLRLFTGLILALVLTVTAQSMAVARSADGPAGQMVLCTGAGPVVIRFDAEGNPVGPPHYCPDCALALFDITAPVAAPMAVRVWSDLSLHPVRPMPHLSRVPVARRARGPPVSV